MLRRFCGEKILELRVFSPNCFCRKGLGLRAEGVRKPPLYPPELRAHTR